jgi:hypothetical protein
MSIKNFESLVGFDDVEQAQKLYLPKSRGVEQSAHGRAVVPRPPKPHLMRSAAAGSPAFLPNTAPRSTEVAPV